MNSLGLLALVAALALALCAGALAIAAARGAPRALDASRRTVYAFACLIALAVVTVQLAFVRDDFSLELVAEHSSTTTPLFYKLTAMWSSQAGSLLLWAFVLGIFTSAVLYAGRRSHRELAPWATAVLMGFGAFFVALMLSTANPFVGLSPAPAEGAGLNPLLRHPSMMIHPPMLYSGYVGFTIPFAFAIAALVTRRVDASWIRLTRRYTLIAWTLLSIGILLGARWSYTELGWGGYWAWDPVENASLMPWLTGTAFLHSVMVQERRGMLKVWNVSLIAMTCSLALLGTFLVRSGVLQSIHAFGASTVGTPLLALIAVVALGSAALIVSRLGDLRAERRLDSLLSRESIFLANNLALVGLCAVIFWGTFFPLISEAVTGTRSSLAAPWFDRYTVPLALVLVLLSGVGPALAWRRLSWDSTRRTFLRPLAAGIAVALVAGLATDAGSEPLALALFAFAAFTLTALAQELIRGTAARRRLAGGSRLGAAIGLVARNRRRFGGYAVHTGIAVLFLGVAGSSSFQTNRDLRLAPGESARLAGYEVEYVKPTVDVSGERIAFGGVLDVSRDGERVALLHPSRNYYPASGPASGPVGRFFEGEATSEVSMRAGLGRDIWTAIQPDLSTIEPRIAEANRRFADSSLDVQGLATVAIAGSYVNHPPPANFRVIVNPMVSWLWIGALIALSGALFALWPARIVFPRRAPRSALEALKESKYREIRDAELDHAQGKLSAEDFALLDAELRREAVAILDQIAARKP